MRLGLFMHCRQIFRKRRRSPSCYGDGWNMYEGQERSKVTGVRDVIGSPGSFAMVVENDNTAQAAEVEYEERQVH